METGIEVAQMLKIELSFDLTIINNAISNVMGEGEEDNLIYQYCTDNSANYSFVIFLSSFFFFWKSFIRYEDSSVTQINVRQVDQKCLDHTKLEKKI